MSKINITVTVPIKRSEVRAQELFNTVRNTLSLFRVLFRTMHSLSCVKFYNLMQRHLVLLIDILNSLKQKHERRSCLGVFKLSLAKLYHTPFY